MSDIRQTLYLMRRVDGKSWRDIADEFPDHPPPTLRRLEHEYRKEFDIKLNAPSVQVDAVTVADADIDGAEVWERAIRVSQRRVERQAAQRAARITFSNGPVCIVQMADWHIGSSGVDYARLQSEIELVRNTDGAYFGLNGDIADNMIVGRLAQIRAVSGEFTMSEEWAMVQHALSLVGEKLLYSVAGNHDLWSLTAGIDRLREMHRTVNPSCIYAKYEQPIEIDVGGNVSTLRSRHNWRGYSQYNATHAIEKAAKFNKGQHFDVGIGAHTHVSGLAREFNNGGATGLAVLCGAYKRLDDYADMLGVPGANDATAVAVIFEDDGGVWGTSNLNAAMNYMQALY